MTRTTKPISPLRQRMIEDMALRKLSPKTQCLRQMPATFMPASVSLSRVFFIRASWSINIARKLYLLPVAH